MLVARLYARQAVQMVEVSSAPSMDDYARDALAIEMDFEKT